MPVRIRLKRMGSKRKPFYRFIVVDSRGKRDGGFLDQVGHYNPISQPHEIKVDEEKLFDWIGKGAQMSDGARSLLKKAGILTKRGSVKAETGAVEADTAATEPPETEPAEAETAATEPPETSPADEEVEGEQETA